MPPWHVPAVSSSRRRALTPICKPYPTSSKRPPAAPPWQARQPSLAAGAAPAAPRLPRVTAPPAPAITADVGQAKKHDAACQGSCCRWLWLRVCANVLNPFI